MMKQEMYYGKIHKTFDELKKAIDKYIRYYNKRGIKASLGYRRPIEYGKNVLQIIECFKLNN
ncbi:IS3 family transposase [Dialister invisus]|uniref:IS3 family transposase n=1 Tax=Dialister invisus TaxID=218538 RepID=UPI003C6D282A